LANSNERGQGELHSCKRGSPRGATQHGTISDAAFRAAAIDIGSNTFRLLIAEPAQPGSATPWHTVYYCHRIVRLGEGLHHSGRLGKAGMQRAMQAFDDFAAILRQHGVQSHEANAVATAAMREAENGAAFRDEVELRTGIRIRIIDGDTEAAMSLQGSCAVLTPEVRHDMLLFDIGGGSTEFIRAVDGATRDAISRKLGVVRLVESFLHTDPPSRDDYAAMVKTGDEHLAEVEAFWGDRDVPHHLVGTAGTVTTLAATELDLCPYDADTINNHRMPKATFLSLRDRLLAMTHAERETIRTIEPGRADLIVAGLAIIEAILERWKFDELVIVDAGLLEGAWLEATR